MKFKVGDKVRVREDLKPDTFYDSQMFNKSMNKYKGGEFTVIQVNEGSQYYNECYYLSNVNYYRFTDKMLEPVTAPSDLGRCTFDE